MGMWERSSLRLNVVSRVEIMDVFASDESTGVDKMKT